MNFKNNYEIERERELTPLEIKILTGQVAAF